MSQVREVYFHEAFAMNDIGDFTEAFENKLTRLAHYKPISKITKKGIVQAVWPVLEKKGYVHKLYLSSGQQTDEFAEAVRGEGWSFIGPWTAIYVTGSSHVVLAFSKPADAVMVKLKLQ